MERKLAAVLFADIVGFTSLNEQHDPEVVQSVVEPAFQRISAEARRYEGVIEKFAGDAMLALFGVPITHEDDAERAVRAALEMQRAMRQLASELAVPGRPPVTLRIGVESGDVLVDLSRADRDRDRMVTGAAVNLAARLQQAAGPGSVVVGPSLYFATREIVEYKALEPIAVKGKAQPVPIWQAVTVRRSRDRRSPFGREAPLIGRERELQTLKEAVGRAAADRSPRLVTVLGTAGIGKSRLAWELEKYLDGLPEAYTWRKGRCLAYGQSSSSALAEALKTDVGLLDDDTSEQATAKLLRRLGELGLTDASGPITRALRATLALDASPELSKEDLFEAWRRYLDAVAARSPLVLVLEDLHWADEGLLDFVEFLTRWAAAPMAIVCLARDELLERRPGWGNGLANATRLSLAPLTDDETSRLMAALLDEPPPAELVARVTAASDGNPLFTEELMRIVLEQEDRSSAEGPRSLRVPGSIQALLAARLDTLPPAERRLARDAAVVGRFFWNGALEHLGGDDRAAVGAQLDGLQAKQLVVARESSSLSGEAEFGFRHVLIRDVAYDTLTKRERAVKHRLVAEWAEVRFAERADEAVDLIASHYASALEYEEAFPSGDAVELEAIRRKTLVYARRAGLRAASLWQLESATKWMRLAVEQGRLLSLPQGELATLILEYLEASEGYETVEATLAASEEAHELIGAAKPTRPPRARGGGTRKDSKTCARRSTPDAAVPTSVRIVRAEAHHMGGRSEVALAMLSEALEILQAQRPTAVRARLLSRLGRMQVLTGRSHDAISTLERAITEAQATGQPEAERWAVHYLGLARGALGEFGEAERLLMTSMELAQAASDRQLLTRCFYNLPSVIGPDPDCARITRFSIDGLTNARESQDRLNAVRFLRRLADLSPASAALRYLDEALGIADEIGIDEWAVRIDRAYCLLRLDRPTEAEAMMNDAQRLPRPDRSHEDSWSTLVRPLVIWRSDPPRALALLAESMRQALHRSGVAEDLVSASSTLAGMALRLRSESERQLAADIADRSRETLRDAHLEAHRRWTIALLNPTAQAVLELHDISGDFAKRTCDPYDAADVLADAALIAARAGVVADGTLARTKALYDELGVVPLYDGLPETRWLASLESS